MLQLNTWFTLRNKVVAASAMCVFALVMTPANADKSSPITEIDKPSVSLHDATDAVTQEEDSGFTIDTVQIELETETEIVQPEVTTTTTETEIVTPVQEGE